jgi:tetratricopeptide (TPR) repeat protein
MEQKTLAREYSYRKKERFQAPLAVSLVCFALALLLPPPERRRRATGAARAAAAVALALAAPSVARADAAQVKDELLLKPSRLTAEGRQQYKEGNAPKALEAFHQAAAARPGDPRAQFNLGGALYKSGKYDEAQAHFQPLAADPRSPLAAAARYNLGNTLFQKQDYPGAIRAYRDALRVAPGDPDTRHNLELALRALQQQQQQKQQPQKQPEDKDRQGQEKENQPSDQQKQKDQQKQDQKPEGQKPERPKTEEEKEKERFEKETGMPKDRAMQLLDALQQNEKEQQKKLQAARQKPARGRKDW